MARQTLIQRSRDKSPAMKASFHQLTGSGRSRVLRQFFGLSDRDETTIVERFSEGLDRLLKESDGR